MLYSRKSLWGGLILHLLGVAWLGVFVAQTAPMALAAETASVTVQSASISTSEITQLTNNLRQVAGLAPLSTNGLLARAAQMKAQDMAAKSYFDHANPEGQRLAYWLATVGYGYQMAGENLAVGYETAAGAMNGWKNSPTHYANIVKPEYTEIGIGVASGIYQGKPVVFVVQHFGLAKTAPVVVEQPVVKPAPVQNTQPVQTAPVQSQPVNEVVNPEEVTPVVPSEETFISSLGLIPSAYAAVDEVENSLEAQVAQTNTQPMTDAIISLLIMLWMIVAFELYVELESHKAWWESIWKKWVHELV